MLQSITRPSLSGATQSKKLSYDAAGNITSDGMRKYRYDARNRMASVRLGETENDDEDNDREQESESASSKTSYLYNSLGQRALKTKGSTTEWSVYDNAGRLANVQRSSEAMQQEFVYLGLAPVAMIETGKTCMSANTTANNPVACNTPKISHLWSDHLGTPRRATDAITNQIVWSWESTPFGETPAQDDPRSTGIKRYGCVLSVVTAGDTAQSERPIKPVPKNPAAWLATLAFQ
jgi:uncharacterized protein RhaS with RHS repeats